MGLYNLGVEDLIVNF